MDTNEGFNFVKKNYLGKSYLDISSQKLGWKTAEFYKKYYEPEKLISFNIFNFFRLYYIYKKKTLKNPNKFKNFWLDNFKIKVSQIFLLETPFLKWFQTIQLINIKHLLLVDKILNYFYS